MEKKKKPSKVQMENRIKNALLFVTKDKDYIGVYFDDKGLRLECTSDFAVVSTNFHRHVFSSVTSSGLSRPYMYIRRFITLANEYCQPEKDENGNVSRSYVKLMETLKEREDNTEYNIAWYIDKWLYNIFQPLYSIGEDTASTFLVYEDFLHNIARNDVILSEKTDDITNKQFVERVLKDMDEFTKNIEEQIIFPKKTDEEIIQEEVQALQEQEIQD